MTPNRPVRLGVVGAGSMGTKHARAAAELAVCDLVGVYDVVHDRALAVARELGTAAPETVEGLCDLAEAIIIATPHTTHARLATLCMTHGCHVLLEKPIASSVSEARTLASASRRTKRVLMIAHVERFNPATRVAATLVNRRKLFAMDFHRLSNAPGRDPDADVVFDLMIHDIDLALSFAGSKVADVEAVGHSVAGGLLDHASAILRFESGVTAAITASTVSHERVRQARFYTRDAVIGVDFANKKVSIDRQSKSSITTAEGLSYPVFTHEEMTVPDSDALSEEHAHFIQAILGEVPPLPDAAAGGEALRVAAAIQERITQQVGRPD